MKKTRFTENGKPVFVTSIGSLMFSHADGKKEEVFGMAPLSHLLDRVDVFDETGHNLRYILRDSVGWRPERLGAGEKHPCPCARCQTETLLNH